MVNTAFAKPAWPNRRIISSPYCRHVCIRQVGKFTRRSTTKFILIRCSEQNFSRYFRACNGENHIVKNQFSGFFAHD